MKIIKILILIFFSAFISGMIIYFIMSIYGIMYIRMTHLSDDDLEWIQPYCNGKSFLFVSNKGNESRMDYTWKYIANSTNRFYASSNPRWNYEAEAGYRYQVKSLSDTLSGSFDVIRFVGTKDLYVYFKLGGRFSWREDGDRDKYLPINPTVFTMGNKTFPDCVIADSTNSRYDADSPYESHSRVETFVISKKYGLIYYKFEDGEEFFRKF